MVVAEVALALTILPGLGWAGILLRCTLTPVKVI
jgi:hypothetical protein